LQQSYAELVKLGAEVFAVNLAEDAKTIAPYMKANGLTMPVLLDRGWGTPSSVTERYGVYGVPTTFVIELDGKIGWVKMAHSSDDAAKLTDAVRKGLSVSPVTPPPPSPAVVWVDAGHGPSTEGWGITRFARIQVALDAVATGGKVNVAEGTYNESQVKITKAVTLAGAGAETTVIDGQGGTGLAETGTVRITAAGNVTVTGFAIRNPKGRDVGKTCPLRVGVYVNSQNPQATYTISRNKITGTNVHTQEEDYGLYAFENQASLIFKNNTVSRTGANAVVLECHVGPTDVSDNILDEGCYGSTAYFNMTHSGRTISSLQNISNNTIIMDTGGQSTTDQYIHSAVTFHGSYRKPGQPAAGDGKFTNVRLAGNKISGLTSYRTGILLVGNGSGGAVEDAVVSGNTISGALGSTENKGIVLIGLVPNARITDNVITGLAVSLHRQETLASISTTREVPVGQTTGGGETEVTLGDGGEGFLARVSVPARAVDPKGGASATVTVTLSRIAPEELLDAKTGRVVGLAEGMEAAGKRFVEISMVRTDTTAPVTKLKRPVKVTLSVPVLSTNPAEDRAAFDGLMVCRYDSILKVWQPLPTRRQYESREVWGYTTELSLFAAITNRDLPKLEDIIDHADEEPILKLVSLKVVAGYGNGLFGPEDSVTREQFAKLLLLAAGIAPDPTAPLAFADTAEIAEWARPYVATATREELIKGVGENRFDPKGKVTRAQVLTMVARKLGVRAGAGVTPFEDDAAIPSWAREEVKTLAELEIVTTDDFTKLEPGKPATRALCARFLARLVDRRAGK
jgi:hypothetical protein